MIKEMIKFNEIEEMGKLTEKYNKKNTDIMMENLENLLIFEVLRHY